MFLHGKRDMRSSDKRTSSLPMSNMTIILFFTLETSILLLLLYTELHNLLVAPSEIKKQNSGFQAQ